MAETLRHKKTGGLYEVLFRNVVIHSDVPLSDDAPVTVCRRLPDGQIVARFGPTPRGSFDVLHHSRLQTDELLHDGADVVVYRALNGGPVWARRAAEMDDGRFEPAHPDSATPSGDGVGASSTPGEVERLVDALIEAAARKGDYEGHAAGLRVDIDPATASKLAMALAAARTALLSHISTAARGEGATPDWIIEFVRAAANTVAQTTLPGSALREVAERAFAWAVEEDRALQTPHQGLEDGRHPDPTTGSEAPGRDDGARLRPIVEAAIAFAEADALRCSTIHATNAELRRQQERGIFPPRVEAEHKAQDAAREAYFAAMKRLIAIAAPRPSQEKQSGRPNLREQPARENLIPTALAKSQEQGRE